MGQDRVSLFIVCATTLLNSINAKVCNVFDLSTKNPSTLWIQGNALGIYRKNHSKMCHDHPTYYHASKQRFIYVSEAGYWIISDRRSYDTCYDFAFFYQPDAPPGNAPTRKGWMFFDERYGNWRQDDIMKARCLCETYHFTSDRFSTMFTQPKMAGHYFVDPGHTCKNIVTYKHESADRFLYVDADQDWVISSKVGHASCSAADMKAFSRNGTASTSPPRRGWRYYDLRRRRWKRDSTIQVVCVDRALSVRNDVGVWIQVIKSLLGGVGYYFQPVNVLTRV